MSSEYLLSYEPQELSFHFELNKQLATSLRLFNQTENHIIFKLLTTKPKLYGVRPRIGVLLPGSDCEITVTKRAMREVPHTMKCKDKFMIQTAIASPGATAEDARNMFCKEAGHVFQECKLQVVYVVPLPEVPSLVAEEPRETAIKTVDPNVSEVTSSVVEPDDDVVQFDQEGSNAEEHDQGLIPSSGQENDTYHGGELIIRGVIICLLGLVLCYVMKQTLSLIWSLSMVVIMLVMKMIKKLVSDSVEDWIVNALLYIFMHIFLKRRENTHQSSESP